MSETLFAFLPFIAIASALTALMSAALGTWRRVAAERRYLSMLAHSRETAGLRERFTVLRAEGGLSDKELRPIADALEDIARNLHREERRLVMAALRQASASGRERYIEHLLGAA